MVTDLVAFLRARLDDDQRIAEEATPGPWKAREEPNSRHSNLYGEADVFGPGPYDNVATDRDGGCASMDDATHIARHDPVRVLAEVAAKRAILDRFHELVTIGIRNTVDGPQRYVECACGWTGDYEHKLDDDAVFETHLRPLRGPGLTPRWVLIQMVSVWRDHPDFDPAWTEETA